jgi:hypothetical protein
MLDGKVAVPLCYTKLLPLESRRHLSDHRRHPVLTSKRLTGMSPKTTAELLAILRPDRSVWDLRAYFNVDTPDERPRYTGARFDTLDGGGDRHDVSNVITPSDLLAVACLDVAVPTSVALELIEGPLGWDIETYLRDIPTNVALGEANADELVAPKSAADRAWWLLEGADNVGWVIAGKVLARKRPHLVPVWDNVVKCAFGRPRENAWLWLDERLRQSSGLREELDRLHKAAGLPKSVSRLRVLDVVIWMRHRCEHLRSSCPGLKLHP